MGGRSVRRAHSGAFRAYGIFCEQRVLETVPAKTVEIGGTTNAAPSLSASIVWQDFIGLAGDSCERLDFVISASTDAFP